MKFASYYYIVFFLFTSIIAKAQVIPNNPDGMGFVINDSIDVVNDTIQLDEIVVSKEKLNPDDKKRYLILKSRVFVTYPYAKLASERLTNLNVGMKRLKTAKEKKKYFKIVEDYLTNEFEARLKKMSRSQGRILVKLIHRQTGSTTYELIKTLKSGWKAFWSNTAASMFDIDLKSEYTPFDVNEDYLIENILKDAFATGRLINQPPANPVDIDKLNEFWDAKKVK